MMIKLPLCVSYFFFLFFLSLSLAPGFFRPSFLSFRFYWFSFSHIHDPQLCEEIFFCFYVLFVTSKERKRNNTNNMHTTLFFCYSAKFQRMDEQMKIENNNRIEIFRYLFVWSWSTTVDVLRTVSCRQICFMFYFIPPKPIILKNFLYLFSHTITNHRLSTSSLDVVQ